MKFSKLILFFGIFLNSQLFCFENDCKDYKDFWQQSSNDKIEILALRFLGYSTISKIIDFNTSKDFLENQNKINSLKNSVIQKFNKAEIEKLLTLTAALEDLLDVLKKNAPKEDKDLAERFIDLVKLEK